MAYYLVVDNGNHYVNRDLAKMLFGVGDSGLFSLLSNGTLKQSYLLGAMVFQVSESCAEKAKKMAYVVVQDMQAQLGCIRKAPMRSAQKIACNQVYACDGFEVACLQDIPNADKYKIAQVVPTLCVCGRKYIVLDAISSDKPCHISLAD